MKFGIIAGAAFVVSLVGATVAGIAMTEPPVDEHGTSADSLSDSTSHVADTSHVPEDTSSNQTDSHGTEEEPADSSSHEPPTEHGDSVSSDSTVSHDADTTTEVLPQPAEPDVNELVLPPESIETRRQESAMRIARILAAMRPRDAAAVLQHMTDQEIVDILRYFNSRKAGAVLAGLSEERAAAISRKLLTLCDGCGGDEG